MNKFIDRVVYTVIVGNYDSLNEVLVKTPGIRYICFTDVDYLKSKTWDIIKLEKQSDNPTLVNRKYKFFPYEYIDCQQSLYIDGNIIINNRLDYLFDEVLKDNHIAIPIHPERDCVFNEIQSCIDSGKVTNLDAQVFSDFLLSHNYPRSNGLSENNIIFRDHTSVALKKCMMDWWFYFNKFAKRDQFTLPFVLHANNISYYKFLEGPRFSNKYFSIAFHDKEKMLPFYKKMALYCKINKHRRLFYYLMDFALSKMIGFLREKN